jgi:hypothetical protein
MKRDMDLIRELLDEQVRLEQLITRVAGGEAGGISPHELQGVRHALQRAIDALQKPDDPDDSEAHAAPDSPSPYLLQMTEWLGRKIQVAQRSNPFIAPMIRDAGHATAALQGLEGKALEEARSIQDSTLRSLIRLVLETREIRRR